MSKSDEVFLPLARVDFSEESFTATLQQVVDLACMGVYACSMAGLTLLDRQGPTTAVATSPAAMRVDAVQYAVNSGPCLDAYRHQKIYRIESTADDQRWVEFSKGALAEGVRSTLSLPLIVNGDGIGALNLYSEKESGFDDADERTGVVFASHASVTLANARAYWQTEELRRNLEVALETRGVIDQAKGILMAREAVSADQAFDVLKRASQRSNRKIYDIATEIVSSASSAIEGSEP